LTPRLIMNHKNSGNKTIIKSSKLINNIKYEMDSIYIIYPPGNLLSERYFENVDYFSDIICNVFFTINKGKLRDIRTRVEFTKSEKFELKSEENNINLSFAKGYLQSLVDYVREE